MIVNLRHRLTDKNRERMTAVCSICGPGTEIRKNGKYGYVCMTARREARRNWKKAHPRAKDWTRSEHRLERRDGMPDQCSKCGAVEVKAWGRGWICANLVAEKKWTVTQLEPTPKCRLCNRLWLVDGKCPGCDAPPEPDLIQRRSVDWFEAHLVANGLTIHAAETTLLHEQESVVPGWKTLGSATAEPPKIRPEYAALYGSGRS